MPNDLSPIVRRRVCKTWFILCEDDGTELTPVPEELVEITARLCRAAGRGYVTTTKEPRTFYE